MAFDERLAERIREVLADRSRVSERKMFGGIAFMVRGHMCCGVVGARLMVRVGPDNHAAALARRHAEPMDFTGRPLRGMVYVRPEGLRTGRQLRSWIERGLSFVDGLPTETSAKRRSRRAPSGARSRRETR